MENKPAIVNPGLQKDLDKILALKASIDEIGKTCLGINVTDESTLMIAQHNLAVTSGLSKTIENKRKLIKAPYKAAGDKVDSTAKTLTESLEKAITHLKSQIADWETLRLKKEKEAKESLEAEQKALEAFATPEEKQDIQDLAAIESVKISIAPKTCGVRYTWTFELVDKTQLSPDWTTIDTKAVSEYLSENKEALKDGEVVNGVKFYKKMSITA